MNELDVLVGAGQIYAEEARVPVRIETLPQQTLIQSPVYNIQHGCLQGVRVLHCDRAMEYFRPILLFLVLFALDSLFCWIVYGLFLVSPMCGIGLFFPGVLGVVLAVDAIKAVFLP